MELAAVHLARSMAFVETIDLNPKGKVFFPDLVKALVARYHFLKFPQKLEDFDDSKGITFAEGTFEGVVVDQLIIYRYGIVVDTRVSTQESKRLLEEALRWGSKELGLANRPIIRWQYVSQVTFYSKYALTVVHPALQRLMDATTSGVSESFGESVRYELSGIFVDHDPLSQESTPLEGFLSSVEKTFPFAENKYYSDAPLPTDPH